MYDYDWKPPTLSTASNNYNVYICFADDLQVASTKHAGQHEAIYHDDC